MGGKGKSKVCRVNLHWELRHRWSFVPRIGRYGAIRPVLAMFATGRRDEFGRVVLGDCVHYGIRCINDLIVALKNPEGNVAWRSVAASQDVVADLQFFVAQSS